MNRVILRATEHNYGMIVRGSDWETIQWEIRNDGFYTRKCISGKTVQKHLCE